ncbi:MAG: adenylate/guanylate cyclase domain-containing protein [Nocardioides sp.]|nr:adenylate/guanylate cyclase domain-containing protein [Nocardioides sp.]
MDRPSLWTARLRHTGPVLDRLSRRAYAALGSRYPVAVVGVGVVETVFVAVVSVLVLGLFFRPELGSILAVAGLAALLTASSVTLAAWRARGDRCRLGDWMALSRPTPRETVEAWEIATTLTLEQYRRSSPVVMVVSIVPTAVAAALLWDIGWTGLLAVTLAGVIPGLYATVLSYSLGERLLRPVVEHGASELPDDFSFEARGLPLRKRLMLAVPAYTTTSAVLVGGLVGLGVGEGSPSSRLLLTVVLSLGIGLFMSLELTGLLSGSITRPLLDVREQLARVRDGDLTARAPVVSSDELGELARDFNTMARGLAEREELREHFGTYVDREIVRLILAGQVPQEGFEVEVSVLFVDVRGFTTYAESVPAPQVVETLNGLFAEMVPVVEAFGGHVDKFIGDGLMAVFGAPETQVDHADRALEAARMIVDAVHLGSTGLRVAAGINSGRVVAGPIGGAGRLNFSVIGDVVNVAARVEAATRETGDDVLITAATRDLLTRPHALASRGEVTVKGKSRPLEVWAPLTTSSWDADTDGQVVTGA